MERHAPVHPKQWLKNDENIYTQLTILSLPVDESIYQMKDVNLSSFF